MNEEEIKTGGTAEEEKENELKLSFNSGNKYIHTNDNFLAAMSALINNWGNREIVGTTCKMWIHMVSTYCLLDKCGFFETFDSSYAEYSKITYLCYPFRLLNQQFKCTLELYTTNIISDELIKLMNAVPPSNSNDVVSMLLPDVCNLYDVHISTNCMAVVQLTDLLNILILQGPSNDLFKSNLIKQKFLYYCDTVQLVFSELINEFSMNESYQEHEKQRRLILIDFAVRTLKHLLLSMHCLSTTWNISEDLLDGFQKSDWIIEFLPDSYAIDFQTYTVYKKQNITDDVLSPNAFLEIFLHEQRFKFDTFLKPSLYHFPSSNILDDNSLQNLSLET